ncbi:MAG: DUF1549 domain-containing protein, partial [Tepidisphaeraceae bacterium]
MFASSPSVSVRLFLAAVLAGGWVGAADAPAPVDFVKDVQPILQARCYECHGPDEQNGGFRADNKTIALNATDSGKKPIVSGDVDKSDLIKRVRSAVEDEMMPPEGERLTAGQIDLLTRWIQQGASWPADAPAIASATGAKKPPHWSFRKPVKPLPPAVEQADRVRNPIDQFIFAQQETQKLKASPEADKHALIRRAALDLTGLPPTPKELEQFLADTAPDAYDRLLDRLLASPRYGERWARIWLDLARYADSSGYGQDELRGTSSPYRDWLIQAFNRNLPFDLFTTQQLAGDLLPAPSAVERPHAARDQIVATAFHRNTMTNVEGGTSDEEWRIAAVKDRTNVTVQT